ncbi:MAG: S-adenosylmethionine:tRNA ribosyltransferase-isomerase [Bacteroidales bacterium]|nr:S-adenosylmethionine:tRNA ribosyltransferase-isomerase [Bacteroidales bacterium]
MEKYTYTLPENRIAKYPLAERNRSKLLICDKGKVYHRTFRDLPSLVSQEVLMVFNDTRVVQARLIFEKTTGSKIEIFCLEPHKPSGYYQAFQQTSTATWKCLVGNAKKWKKDPLSMKVELGTGTGMRKREILLAAEKTGRDKDAFLIRFHWNPEDAYFGEILEEAGKTPIPPYLKRDAEPQDKHSYQTVYSLIDGSVAAPTAGFHFTDAVLEQIDRKGIARLNLTLHVGAGTFQPVSTDNPANHPMHAEHFYVSRRAIQTLLDHQGEIMAVGTTTTRLLESLFWLGLKLPEGKESSAVPMFLDQWEAYKLQAGSREDSLQKLLRYMTVNGLEVMEGITRLMIVPGYNFRMVNRLITNFHQPGSTLLMLVAAFIGEDWRKVYDYALANDFRFLSYGDSSLLIP